MANLNINKSIIWEEPMKGCRTMVDARSPPISARRCARDRRCGGRHHLAGRGQGQTDAGPGRLSFHTACQCFPAEAQYADGNQLSRQGFSGRPHQARHPGRKAAQELTATSSRSRRSVRTRGSRSTTALPTRPSIVRATTPASIARRADCRSSVRPPRTSRSSRCAWPPTATSSPRASMS